MTDALPRENEREFFARVETAYTLKRIVANTVWIERPHHSVDTVKHSRYQICLHNTARDSSGQVVVALCR